MHISLSVSGRLFGSARGARSTTAIVGFRSDRRGWRNVCSSHASFRSSFLAHTNQIRHLSRVGGNGNHHAAVISTTIQSLFTGIVQGTATVKTIQKSKDFESLEVEFPEGVVDTVSIGSSVALNGTCLTVTKQQEGNILGFDVIVETLRATNLGELAEGEQVNFERAACLGDEIGGHNVSGHIHCTAKIVDIQETENNRRLCFEVPSQWMKYILPKGYIGVDGCSLTIGEVEGNSFSVYLIPETLRVTVFGGRKVGDFVNIEIETQTQAIVDTVERVLAAKAIEAESL